MKKSSPDNFLSVQPSYDGVKKPVIAHSVELWLPLTQTWVYNQLKYVNDFTSIVLTNRPPENLDHFPWEPVYSAEDGGRLGLFAVRLLQRLAIASYPSVYGRAITKHNAAILHSHFADMGWRDLRLAEKYGLKHVVTFYGYDINMMPRHSEWRERYRRLFERADLFLCEGPHMAKCAVDLGCPEEKVKVQRLGVEIDKIPFVPRRVGKDGVIKILIAGSFREKKGIPYALEAVGILREKYPNIRVTVIGDSTGKRKEELEKKKILNIIDRYHLGPVVRLLGFQSFGVLMKEAFDHHVFLSPSVTSSDGDTEGGAPVTIIEMSASGMPVISTWHCDIPEVLQDGLTGYLTRERDVDGISLALERLIENPELSESFGKNGREYIKKNFNIRETIGDLEDKYRELT